MNTSSPLNNNPVSAPFQAAQFFQDGVGVKTLKASDYVYHTSNYTPIRALGVSFRNAPGLRGGNSGMYPTERNTQAFALAASNLSTNDYRTMMSLSAANASNCDQLQIKMDQAQMKINNAPNDSARATAMKEYESIKTSYNAICLN